MSVAQQIKKLRQELHYNQQMFAEKVGISRSVLSQIEIHKIKPSVELLASIIRTFKVSADYFFVEKEHSCQTFCSQDEKILNDRIGQCSTCRQLIVINEAQKDIFESLQNTINTQQKLIDALEKRLNDVEVNNEQPGFD